MDVMLPTQMPKIKRAVLYVFQSVKNNARVALISQPLQWRHNGHDDVSNHQPQHYLLNRLVGRGSKKTSKLRVTGLCAGNWPVTGEFLAQRASYAENVSIWWRHHVSRIFSGIGHFCIYKEYDAYIHIYMIYTSVWIYYSSVHVYHLFNIASRSPILKTFLKETCSGCIEIISDI